MFMTFKRVCRCIPLFVLLAASSAVWAAPDSQPGKAAQTPAAPEKAEAVAAPELIARGKALLTGASRFSKGGAPCIACHAFNYPGVRGGNLAVDLTQLYGSMGEEGLKEVFKSMDFPTMKKIYAERQLTDDEIAALTALFKDASARAAAPGSPLALPLAGGGLFALIILGLTFYKRRIG